MDGAYWQCRGDRKTERHHGQPNLNPAHKPNINRSRNLDVYNYTCGYAFAYAAKSRFYDVFTCAYRVAFSAAVSMGATSMVRQPIGPTTH